MEAVKGTKLVYLYRVHSEEATNEGKCLAFTTENSFSMTKDAESTATKDGSIRTPGPAEITISATSILTIGDTMIKRMQKACRDGELMDIWEANLEEPALTNADNDKFAGTYYQGYLTSFEKTSSAEGFVEVSVEFGINGNGAEGMVTVNAQEQEQASYVFTDTTTKSNLGA